MSGQRSTALPFFVLVVVALLWGPAQPLPVGPVDPSAATAWKPSPSDTSPLQVAADATPPAGTCPSRVPFFVNFTESANGGLAPYNYTWNSDDGGPTSGATQPEHEYNQSDHFLASLIVRDATGTSAASRLLIGCPLPSGTSGPGPGLVAYTVLLSGVFVAVFVVSLVLSRNDTTSEEPPRRPDWEYYLPAPGEAAVREKRPRRTRARDRLRRRG